MTKIIEKNVRLEWLFTPNKHLFWRKFQTMDWAMHGSFREVVNPDKCYEKSWLRLWSGTKRIHGESGNCVEKVSFLILSDMKIVTFYKDQCLPHPSTSKQSLGTHWLGKKVLVKFASTSF